MIALTHELLSQMFLSQQGRTDKNTMCHARPQYKFPKTFFLRVFTVYLSCFHSEDFVYTQQNSSRELKGKNFADAVYSPPLLPPPSSLPGETPGTLETFLSDYYYTIQCLFQAGNMMFQRQLDLLFENGGGEARQGKQNTQGLSILNSQTHSQIQTS